jgi:hypothetical protein
METIIVFFQIVYGAMILAKFFSFLVDLMHPIPLFPFLSYILKKRKAVAPSSSSSPQSLSESLPQHAISDKIQDFISCFDHYG